MTRAALLLMTALVAAGPSIAPVHTQVPAGDEARLLRFPAIHGNQLVFTYAGDLYTVPATGGVARRLTSDAGFEMFARFSPDGKSIAFTGQYDGNTEVYLMPGRGGNPEAPDLHGHAGARRCVRSDGPEQHRHRLEERHADSVSIAADRVERLPRPALPGIRRRRAPRASCPCRAAGSAASLRTASSSSTTGCSASSARGSGTAAARPTRCGCTTSRRRRRRTSPGTRRRTSSRCGRGPRCTSPRTATSAGA